MKKLVSLFVIGAVTFVMAGQGATIVPASKDEQPATVTLPVDPTHIGKLLKEFRANLPVDVKAKIQKRRQKALQMKKKIEEMKKVDPVKAQEMLQQCYKDAMAKRDQVLAQLPDDVKKKVQARLAEIEKKIEARKAKLEEKLKEKTAE